jgi:hypothetical protein
MKKTLALLMKGFESSSTKTPEFKSFCSVFKKEFTCELESIGAVDIVFTFGHFYISGFFTIGKSNQKWYFSLSDIRGLDYSLVHYPDSCQSKLMYREVKDYKDYTGKQNRYAKIETGMAEEMCWSFKLV